MIKNLVTKKREPLVELIPLETPFTLRIEPTNLCNFACKFCPTGNKNLLSKFNRPQGIMEYKLYKKIIDDLKVFNSKLKKLYFYKDGESLLNPTLVDMIQYAKDKDVAEELWLFTNGTLLNPKINRRLIKAGLTLLQVSVYGVSDESYYKNCNRKVDYKKLIENITDLYNHRSSCKIHIKLLGPNFSSREKRKFIEDFESISNSIFIENLHGWSMSDVKDFTLNTNPTTTPEDLPFIPKEVCPYPFFTLSVNFNGTVSVCCIDWSHSTIVGDLRKQSLYEIWNGKKLFEFRVIHLKKERSRNRACKNCYHLSSILDNIDNDAHKILKKLQSKKEVRI